GLQILTRLDERRDETPMCKRKIWTDRDSAAGRLDRLTVLLQRDMIARFNRIRYMHVRVVRALSNRPIEESEAFFKASECPVYEAHVHISVQKRRVQGECAFVLYDGFVETPLSPEYPGFLRGSVRGRPLETGGLDLGELDVQRARQTGDDLVLRLQQTSAGGVELIGPEV